MKIKRYDLLIIGAGPAGLSAAIEAAELGMKVLVFDENARPGGQLFKQIHKFFGSKEHKAKTRGFRIGQELLAQAEELGVEVYLNSIVTGIYDGLTVSIMKDDSIMHFRGDNIIIATGATENLLPFKGWTKPGVMGAGAAQTLMNLHGVQPGENILMVGTGNVGLVVSYQLKQAGCNVKAIIDASPRIGGYGVHAAKLARTGVPFLLSHTIVEAKGDDCVKSAVIAEVDSEFKPIPGTEKELDVDTVCLAVGLSPMSQIARMAGCIMENRGGAVPKCDEYGRTSVPGIFAAGDVAGIEEASSAMIQGRISAIAAAYRGGYIDDETFAEKAKAEMKSLKKIRSGMFAPGNKGRTDIVQTSEGLPLSMSLLKKGYMEKSELDEFPQLHQHNYNGIHPVIECTQNIPCNPCQDVCPKGCIMVGADITKLPAIDGNRKCSGCGMCVANCPGQAIFLVEEKEGSVEITIPYEFIPLPEIGEKGVALSRKGTVIGEATVTNIRTLPINDHTTLLTMSVSKEIGAEARFYKGKEMQEMSVEFKDRGISLGEMVPEEDEDILICRCEEITKGEIRRAICDGMFTMTEIRRYLRTGMGLCQGQTCGRLVKQILERELSKKIDANNEVTARAPMRPVDMGVYGNEVPSDE